MIAAAAVSEARRMGGAPSRIDASFASSSSSRLSAFSSSNASRSSFSCLSGESDDMVST